MVSRGAVGCPAAVALVRRYYLNPPTPPEGSSGSVQIGSWLCASSSGTGTELTGNAGSCTGPRGTILMET